VAEQEAGYILMHMQGTPETMQTAPTYTDCVAEVTDFLAARLAAAERAGIARERTVVDPGIGFGKRLQDNLALLRAHRQLASLGRPVLYGVSRKSFMLKACQDIPPGARPETAEQRLPGTLGVTWYLLDQGVRLHRLHDAAAGRQLFALWEALQCSQ
jgi:dihydropteroate synthase